MTRASKIASMTVGTDDSSNKDEESNQWVAPINDTSVTLTDEQIQALNIVQDNISIENTCLYYNGDDTCIYDSLSGDEKAGLSVDERTFVVNRYPWIDPEEVIFKNVTRQGNDLTICGVYAVAFATSIALGENPSSVNYSVNAEEMRNHLATIIQNRMLTSFPEQ
ncbi:hypothetical protein KQX54_011485 [Cotesia glomerata]|uniref:Uncharacterized protein n=1 Tax=Cotesia glomerata TaxID=32391 RepID=A0AAV7HWT0_COTGL|nr:hypothetical protein KQX54_011485 [Cotesia glomerata]